MEGQVKDDVFKYTGPSFHSLTRIALSNPIMWRDIFLNNRTAILDILQRFKEDLGTMQKAIRRGDGDYLQSVLTRGNAIRKQMSALDQE